MFNHPDVLHQLVADRHRQAREVAARDVGAASTVRCSGLAGVTAGEPHQSRSLTGVDHTAGP